MEALRTCNTCGVKAYTKEELLLFVPNKECAYGRTNQCQKCKAKVSRENHLKRKYNITINEYEEMLLEQDCKCKICKDTDPKRPSGVFVVDHCHTTGEVRGLLCDDCNLALGKFKDNEDVLLSAIDYLRKTK
jgi:hypothetical protein